MKRIIDGVTYNTDTSTRLAESDYEADYNHSSCSCTGRLYQTRGGAYFVHEAMDLGYLPEVQERDLRHRFRALSLTEAQEWIMTGDVEIIHNPFSDPPEAEAEADAGATIYIRVPSSLKKRVDDAAKSWNLSTNVMALRCMERCVNLDKNLSDIATLLDRVKSGLNAPGTTQAIAEALAIVNRIQS